MVKDSAANSTTQEEVYRSDGIRLYGLDAEIELKMQSKRDKGYEKEIAKWIEEVLKEKMTSEDIADALQSGIVLCKLLNAIQPGTVKNINTKPIALMQVENIQLYLKGCWNLGVPTSDLFVTSDLFQKKGIPQVLQNIVSLARVSQTLPGYKGPRFGAKLSAPAPVKKWETVETNQVVYATDLQSKSQGIQVNACAECGTPKKHLAKGCDKCGADFSKQGNVDVEQIIANLKATKQQLEAVQAKYQKAEEENKKLAEQLKQAIAKSEKPAPEPARPYTPSYVKTEPKPEPKAEPKPEPPKPEPVKTEPIKTEPAKTETPRSVTARYTVNLGSSSSTSSAKPAAKPVFGAVQSFVPAPNSAPFRNFSIPSKSKPAASTNTPTSNNTTNTNNTNNTTNTNNTNNATYSSYTKPEVKPAVTKVEPAKVEPAKVETTSTSNTNNKNSSFGPRNLRSGGDESASKTYDTNKATDLDKRKLEMENARLAKDNAKLMTDYQNVERKYREEAAKSKEMDDKLRVMERKLEASGVQAAKDSRPVNNNKHVQMTTIRYRPSLRNKSMGTGRNNLNGMASDLHKRLTRPPEAFENLEVDIEPDMIRYAKDCMVQILFSKPIDFADVYSLHDLFSTDSGRRCFIQIMQQTMKEIPTLVLSDNSFELLLYLINTVLQEMDISDSKDLIAAKVLMHCACSLSRKSGDTFQFIREFIHNYSLWKDTNFWEEYFWDTLAKKHRKKFGEQIKGVDKELTLNLIASFAYNMLNWECSKEMAKSFSYEMAGRNNISKGDISHVEMVIANFQGTEAKRSEEGGTQHKFHDKFLVKPTFCQLCHQFIWGLTSKQAYKCEDCKCKIHKKCLKDAQSNLPCHTVLKEVKLKT